jgi:hypothetical protein
MAVLKVPSHENDKSAAMGTDADRKRRMRA